jgi:hypothetical protein
MTFSYKHIIDKLIVKTFAGGPLSRLLPLCHLEIQISREAD